MNQKTHISNGVLTSDTRSKDAVRSTRDAELPGAGKKVLVAMSGGVDSSVTLCLLRDQGYECIGVTMRLYDNEDDSVGSKTCCSLSDVEDARAVAYAMGVSHYTMECTDEFARDVIQRFVDGYEAGTTPNPCIACNRYLKFDLLYSRARQLGCDYIATGHYARITCNDGIYHLRRGVDSKKDQSYVLNMLSQEKLAHTLLPLGGLTKVRVRQIAERYGLVNAEKQESQDICFVPNGDYVGFLESYTGHTYAPGNFVDVHGNVLGRHQGTIRYTIGQRKGLGVSVGHPLYVVSKNALTNEVDLGTREDLERTDFYVDDVQSTGARPLRDGMRVDAVTRYRGTPHPATIETASGDASSVHVVFDDPQIQIAPGQSCVFYQPDAAGDIVLGGGIIR